jgi:metallo-beta-lactamase class B
MKHAILPLLILLLWGCKSQQLPSDLLTTEDLKIEQLTANTFLHVSYLETQTFGKVACNGMIVKDKNEAIIFDTPVDDAVSAELIEWVEKELKCKVKAIVVTHFHIDCLGGLAAFHEKGIPSYANALTIELAKKEAAVLPQNSFTQELELAVGKEKAILFFPGEGHTKDNIVSYFPNEQVLFGGCLVKSLKSGKGNLADANVSEWSNTVRTVKSRFNEASTIIPGHGKFGDQALLDYTIKMFESDEY